MKQYTSLYLAALLALAPLLLWHCNAQDNATAPAVARTLRPQTLPPIKAKLLITDGKAEETRLNREVNLLGRTPNAVLAQGTSAGSPPAALIEKSQILRCTFAPVFDRAEMVKALNANDWAAAVRILLPALRPILPYLDLPNNDAFDLVMDLGSYMTTSANAELRAATDDTARERAMSQYDLAYDIYRNAWRADWTPQAQIAILKGCLVKLAQNKNRDAANSLARIVAPSTDEPTYGHYWLVRGELLRRGGKTREAIEAVVKSIVFANKDVETFPASLLLSADCYTELGELHRARDVYYEIATLFPDTDWAEDALKGLRQVMANDTTRNAEESALEDVFFNVTEDTNELADELLKQKMDK